MATKYHVLLLEHNSITNRIEFKFPETQKKVVGYKFNLDLRNLHEKPDNFPSVDIAKIVVLNKDGDVCIDDILNYNMCKREGFIETDIDLNLNKNFYINSSLTQNIGVEGSESIFLKATFKTI